MANVTNKKVRKEKSSIDRPKKEKNKKINLTEEEKKVNIKIYEKYTCFAVGVIIIILLFAVFNNSIFIPALLITIGLELFTIAYYYMDNKDKKSLVYVLFQFGVALVIAAIIYTIFKTV